MSRIESLKKISNLTKEDMKVFLSLVFSEEDTYSSEETIESFKISDQEDYDICELVHKIKPIVKNMILDTHRKAIEFQKLKPVNECDLIAMILNRHYVIQDLIEENMHLNKLLDDIYEKWT